MTSKPTVCLHPQIEASISEWFRNRTKPAVFLIGPPGVGKTTLAYRVMEQAGLRVSEFNASHTRSGNCFRKTILPLLERGGVIHQLQHGNQGGLGVILDEIDGLSTGEKGGLSSLLDYLRDWKPDRPGVPVIFISNSLSQRTLLMLTRYCITIHVGQPDTQGVQQLIGHDLPAGWKTGGGDLRPLLRGEYDKVKLFSVADPDEEGLVEIPDGVVPLSHWVLNNEIDPLMVLQLENNDSNLAGLVIAENIPDRLDGAMEDKRAAWLLYKKLFECIQESDYADYWAFFYQTWRLLGLSQEVKINTINRIIHAEAQWLQDKERIPLESIRYTPVLTKQSALFNAWKLLCEIADTQGVPIRLTPFVLMRSNEKKPEKRKKIEAMNFTSLFAPPAPAATSV